MKIITLKGLMLDTYKREPDSATVSSSQALWLKQGLASSESK
jgi:hypothetical protein